MAPLPLPSSDPDSSASRGPFVTALLSAVAGAVALGAVVVGKATTLLWMLGVVAPGVMLCGTGVAVSMGWIFVLKGRQGRVTWKIWWTAAFLGMAIAEMLVVIFLFLRMGAGGT